MKFNEIPLELLKEWDFFKNKDLEKIILATKIWWICGKGHSFQARLSNRMKNKSKCPYCSGRKATIENCLKSTHPEIVKSWHPSKNKKITPYDVKKGTKLKIWWICEKGHEWEESPKVRITQNQDCPYCSGKRVSEDNCLSTLYPKILKEWDYNRNIISPDKITTGSSKYVWWLCAKKHSYKMTVNNKINRKDCCPYCSNKRVCFENCLNTIFPDISKEWHPVKNKGLTTHDFMSGSSKKVWWLCEKGHSYLSVISSRTGKRKSGCPYCLYKTEQKVREIFKNILKKNFPKRRPKWLINPETNYPLELDGYNEELKLAFEYDGKWHKEPHPKSSYSDFQDQLKRDELKDLLSKENKIILIRISYKDNLCLEHVIKNKLKKLSFV